MKNLQESSEESWKFTSFAELRGVVSRPSDPQEIILLLHGLGERGKRIMRKLLPHLPKNALILAPNGPFPLARQKENRLSFGHSWYFYDKFERTYFINQDLAKFWLRDLMEIENPNKLPLTIIGFSQGGYLAPLVGEIIPETKLVIGLACEFRQTLIQKKPPFPMVAIHGDKDEVITSDGALKEIENLKSLDINIDWHLIPDTTHEISTEMGKVVKKVLEQYGN